MRRHSSWTRKLAFLAIIWGFSLTAVLATTELVMRLTESRWDNAARLNVIRNRQIVWDVRSLYAGGPGEVVYNRNAYGLRDDCSSPAAIDILTMGGSTTDQRYVPHASTFQGVMERDLGAKAGRPVCVSNAGVDGHSTYGHLLSFRDWFPVIPGLNPKVIMFSVGINDADFLWHGPNIYEVDDDSWRNSLQIVKLARWAKDVIYGLASFGARSDLGHKRVSTDPSAYTAEQPLTPIDAPAIRNAEEFRGRLRKLIAAARGLGAEPLCVTQPHRLVKTIAGKLRGISFSEFGGSIGESYGNRYNGLDFDRSLQRLDAVIREECGQGRVVELATAPFADEDFYDGVHTTPSGSTKEGHRIAEFMIHSDIYAPLLGLGDHGAASDQNAK